MDNSSFQNFTIPTASLPNSGWAGFNDNLNGLMGGLAGGAAQQMALRQQLQQSIALAQAEQAAKIQAQQLDPLYQMRMNAVKSMQSNPQFSAMFGGGQPPAGGQNDNTSSSTGGQSFNPVMSGNNQIPQYSLNPNFMFGGDQPFVDNPAFKQQQEQQKTIQNEIIKGPAEASVGKVTLANESLQNIDDIINALFPDGTPESFDRGLATSSNMPAGWLPGMPSVRPDNPLDQNDNARVEAAQNIYRKMGASLGARQLIQTGVAARPEETAKLVSQFAPNLFSNPQAAYKGLKELKKFYEEYLNTAVPEKRLGNKSSSQTSSNQSPQASKQLDKNMAMQFLQQAGGDKNKARQLAKQQGYKF